MKLSHVCAATLVGAALWNPAAAEVNANFVLGSRDLASEFWKQADLDQQPAGGVNLDFGGGGWPVQIEVGLCGSRKSLTLPGGAEVTVTIGEMSLGFVKIWRSKHRLRPFAGGGIAYVATAGKFDPGRYSPHTEADATFATALHGGLIVRPAGHFNIGVDVRVLNGASIEHSAGGIVFPPGISANYRQIGLILGWGWP